MSQPPVRTVLAAFIAHGSREKDVYRKFPLRQLPRTSPWSACAFVDYLCTVSLPSPSGRCLSRVEVATPRLRQRGQVTRPTQQGRHARCGAPKPLWASYENVADEDDHWRISLNNCTTLGDVCLVDIGGMVCAASRVVSSRVDRTSFLHSEDARKHRSCF